MNDRRWYPTVTSLGTGGMLITGGTKGDALVNGVPQVLSGSTFTSLTSRSWEPWYPMMFAAPNGKAFHATGTDPYSGAISSGFLDTSTDTWSSIGNPSNLARYASAALDGSGKVLLVGGGPESGGCDLPSSASASAQLIDLTASSPSWSSQTSMSYAREYLNTTILADGTIFVTGGQNSSGAVAQTELWSPGGHSWTTMASMTVETDSHSHQNLGYHSVAVLLPDGRVLAGGGGVPGSSSTSCEFRNVQIYSPSYLFASNGQLQTRPTIDSAPDLVRYSQQFDIQASGIISGVEVNLEAIS